MSAATVAILGGGVAGVTAAACLARSGHRVELFEMTDRLGGLQHSPLVDGIPHDIGTFLFNPDHEYFRVFPGLAARMVPLDFRMTALKPAGSLDVYPFSMRGYLRDYGHRRFAADLLDLAACKVTARRRDTFRRYCTYYLGTGIYERSGLKAYIERLYFIPDREIALELALHRLAALEEHLSLRRIALRLVRRRRMPGPPPPWRCFVRPPGGFQEMYGHVRAELEAAGVVLHLGCRPAGIVRQAGKLVLATDGGSLGFDRVISTIPMDTAAGLLGVRLPVGPRTMQLVSLFYCHHGEPAFDGECLTNYSLDGAWKRLTVFSRYYGRRDGVHRLIVECTVPDDEIADVDGRRRDFESHIARWPVLPGRLDFRGSEVTRWAYPILRAGEESSLAEARGRLEAAGIHLAGRQGRFGYLNSATVARQARELAETIDRSTQ